jgi:peptidoglycan hydrolase CwlO-like protein
MTIETILTILGSNVVVAFFGYLTGLRKTKAETDNQVLLNLELSINLYKEVIDDLRTEVGQLKRRIQELEEKIDELHAENKKLKSNL